MKYFILLFFLFSSEAYSQEKFTRYYDSNWVQTPKEKAYYYVDMVKEDTLYRTTGYYAATNSLQARSYYADTAFYKPRGLLTRYNKNGTLTDSSFHYATGNARYKYHYFDNGKLQAYYIGNEKGEQIEVKGYDENGKEIKDYIFLKEAEFPGGGAAWMRYVSKNIKTKVPVKNGAPYGEYKVIVRFIVGKDGTISDAIAETRFGYGMEMEALRVIQNAPKWKNAIQYNKPVNAYRRQPITFVVQ